VYGDDYQQQTRALLEKPFYSRAARKFFEHDGGNYSADEVNRHKQYKRLQKHIKPAEKLAEKTCD
jgi:hypothetical protein